MTADDERGDKGPAALATCRGCGATFAYDPGYYRQFGLVPPLQCRKCRVARDARMVTVRAVVTTVKPVYAFAQRADDGTPIYISLTRCPPGLAETLRVGDPVTVTFDATQPLARRYPKAFRVRKL